MMPIRRLCRSLTPFFASAVLAPCLLAQAPPTLPSTATPAVEAPSSRPPAAKPGSSINLVFEDARQQAGLSGKAEAAQALLELGDHAGAAKRYADMAVDWQKLTTQWRDQALTAIENAAAGHASAADAARAVDLYARGESEVQKAIDLATGAHQTGGREGPSENAVLERVRELRLRASSPALSEALSGLVRDAENRALALADLRTAERDADGAFFLFTKLHAGSVSQTRRQGIVEKLLSLYSDLISERRLRVAAKIAVWYVDNHAAQSSIWRQETIRLVQAILGTVPACGASSGHGKEQDLAAPDAVGLLCRFFVTPGTATPAVWLLLAQAYRQSGELGDAIRWYELALAADGHDAQVRMWLAEACAAVGKIDSAVRHMIDAINLGYSVRRALDNPELAALRQTPAYRSLERGSLF
ncbi:MAG: tetratricopeptide repeat protein [Candidatus Wallbacteria bacterium]|nr:tetratricopeptide repeat protein [Candidatus Wallbacteria bacterium]